MPEDQHRLERPADRGSSAVALGVCGASFFFDSFGVVLAAIGLFLLWKKNGIPPGLKLGITLAIVLPRMLFWWFASLNPNDALVFRFEPVTPVTSQSMWMSYGLLWAAVLFIITLLTRSGSEWLRSQGVWFKVENAQGMKPRDKIMTAGIIGFIVLALVIGRSVVFFGLANDFHTVQRNNGGTWSIQHDIKGNRAVFAVNEIDILQGKEDLESRQTTDYDITVRLTDGRSFTMRTDQPFAFDELRSLAMTLDIEPRKVKLIRNNGQEYPYNPSGRRLRDFAGTYVAPIDKGMRSGNILELELRGNTLAGKETIVQEGRSHTRMLEHIRVTDSGELSARAGNLLDIQQKPADSGGTLTQFSLHFEPEVKGTFRDGGIEIAGTLYTKQLR